MDFKTEIKTKNKTSDKMCYNFISIKQQPIRKYKNWPDLHTGK